MRSLFKKIGVFPFIAACVGICAYQLFRYFSGREASAEPFGYIVISIILTFFIWAIFDAIINRTRN